MTLLSLSILCLALAAIAFALFVDNLLRFTPSPPATASIDEGVSILIPARNEEAAIAGCLRSVLAWRDPRLEVIVLNDCSTDQTAEIVRDIASRDPRVRLEASTPLPGGWCGKQHACHQLARHASGPWLVFIDADVRLEADAIPRAIAFARRSGAALVSGFPKQQTITLAEKLLIPLIHFVLLSFLPIRQMRRRRSPAYGAGCGQFFVARASAYHRAGGHAAIRQSMHDGVTLPRTFRAAGLCTDLFDATDIATCRMYNGLRQTWSGLAKNAIEGMASPAAILPWTILLGAGQVLPPVLLILAATAPHMVYRPAVLTLSAVATLLGLIIRLVAVRRFEHSLTGALLHPVGVAMLLTVQWFALIRHLAGVNPTWRGRACNPRSAMSG